METQLIQGDIAAKADDPGYSLKTTNADFRVEELWNSWNADSGEFSYAVLEKSGYSTFDAVSMLAAKLGIPEWHIGYSGLKDEDAVTRQMISVKGAFTGKIAFQAGLDKWVKIAFRMGKGDRGISKGDLHGNHFDLRIRNISARIMAGLGDTVGEEGKMAFRFVNYFDRQRFGVPGGRFETPAIGESLLRGDEATSARILDEEGVELERKGAALPIYHSKFMASIRAGESHAEAFRRVDGKVRAFFAASYFSLYWNRSVSAHLASLGGARLFPEGHHPMFECRALPDECLEEVKAVFPFHDPVFSRAKGKIEIGRSFRPVLSTSKVFLRVLERTPLGGVVQAKFHLPSGSYATMLVHQLMMQFHRMGDPKESRSIAIVSD